jgi:hypothetical protein
MPFLSCDHSHSEEGENRTSFGSLFPASGYVFTRRYWSMTPSGLSHSEIHGSKLVRQLPVAYRSQTASFIASWRQNIHHAPFVAWPPFFLASRPLRGPNAEKRR